MIRDSAYIHRVSSLLQKFKSTGGDRFSFRCPYCGDSKKDPDKTRGCFKPAPYDSSKLIFKCFNCDISRSFKSFLRDIDESIYRDYLRESVKSRGSFSDSADYDEGFWSMPAKGSADPIRKWALPEDFFTPLLDLPDEHEARVYIAGRKVPEECQTRIWFTSDFRSVSNNLDREKFAKPGQIWPESRVVLPCMEMDGSRMSAFQGRSLEKDAKVRYIMIRNDPQGTRLFGLDSVNPSSTVMVLEGPIDTFFVKNSIALCGASVSVEIPVKDRIFYLDQEPRNPQIVGRLYSLVESGERICILPDEFSEKDANEIHIEMGLSRSELYNLAVEHSYSGLRAKLKLSRWAVSARQSQNNPRKEKHDR